MVVPHEERKIMHARMPARRDAQPEKPSRSHPPAEVPAATRPLQALQRLAAARTGAGRVLQRTPHKPKEGQRIRYPADGPRDGNEYIVEAADDGGGLTLKHPGTGRQSHANWKTNAIWLVYAADAKDTDQRVPRGEWAGYSKDRKQRAYDAAKDEALVKIKASAAQGMKNETNRTHLRHLTLGFFNRAGKGEWTCRWEEANTIDRVWQFTIDMDRPLETSWQEPHVGWEVKLVSAGTDNNGRKLAAFDKQQGHVWLNDVPEAR
jgi:hypothetical protein